jgi:hypothetical protein
MSEIVCKVSTNTEENCIHDIYLETCIVYLRFDTFQNRYCKVLGSQDVNGITEFVYLYLFLIKF